MGREAISNEEAEKNRLPIRPRPDEVRESAKGGDASDLPKGYFYSTQFIGTLVAVCSSTISGYLGWILPANTLALIDADIGPSPNIAWVPLVWILGDSIGFALFGRLSDIFSRRYFMIGVQLFGLIGMCIGATATSVEMLIAANVFNGIASGGQFSFPIIMGELVPNKARGVFNSIILFSSMPFAVFGPVIARSLIINTAQGWRSVAWSFYIGIIITAISTVMFWQFYHPPTYDDLHVNGKSKWEQIKSIDYLGIFLFFAGMTLALIGLNWGGAIYPWKSAEVIATIVAGAVMLMLLVAWESVTTLQYPLIPVRLFAKAQFNAIVICATVTNLIFFAMTILWPNLVTALFTTDVSHVGWLSCTIGGGFLSGQVLAGFTITYLPKMKVQAILVMCIVTAFVGALASVNPNHQDTAVGLLLVGCAGVGFIENMTLSSVSLVWEPEDIGLAVGVLGSIRSAGGAVATAIFTTILNSKLSDYLSLYVTRTVIDAGLSQDSVSAILKVAASGKSTTSVAGVTDTLANDIAQAIKIAHTKAYATVFYTTIAFSAIGIIAAFWIPNIEHYLTDNVARKLGQSGARYLESQPDEESVSVGEKKKVVG